MVVNPALTSWVEFQASKNNFWWKCCSVATILISSKLKLWPVTSTLPGFKSRVPEASFSYIVSITKRVIFSRDHTNLYKIWKFDVDWVKWKRDTSIQISKEMFERRTICPLAIHFFVKFGLNTRISFKFYSTAPNFGIVLKNVILFKM